MRADSSNELKFFAEIADWVEAETSLGAHILGLLERSSDPSPEGMLGFLSRAKPGSATLLDACLRALGARGERASNDPVVQVRAADIVASQFASDPVLEELLRVAGDDFPDPGVLVAVCRGWPNHEWLTATYARAVAEKARSSELGVFELRCARASSEDVAAEVRYLVEDREPLNAQVRRSMMPSLIRRVRRDEDVADRLRSVMQDPKEGLCLRMAAARLLTAGLGSSEGVRLWSAGILAEASRAGLWPASFDILSGRVRCVQDLVWDLLGSTP